MRLSTACATLMFISTSVLAAGTDDVQIADDHIIPAENQPAPTLCKGKANRIVVYSASWCRPCRQLKPVIGSLKDEGYQVVYQDVDKDNDQLKYKYTAVPTIFFLCGEVVIKKETGYRSKRHIKKMLMLDVKRAPAKHVLEWK
jgi:thioredoxin 1